MVVYSVTSHWSQELLPQKPSVEVPKRIQQKGPLQERTIEQSTLMQKYAGQGLVKFKSLRMTFSGPPCVGKTTLKKRLMREMVNISKTLGVPDSSGVQECVTVEVGCAVI